MSLCVCPRHCLCALQRGKHLLGKVTKPSLLFAFTMYKEYWVPGVEFGLATPQKPCMKDLASLCLGSLACNRRRKQLLPLLRLFRALLVEGNLFLYPLGLSGKFREN